ncbi:hypothetical protein BDR05DRAFT_952840 [Suillus weaverae]|nr:hypothetical protein BDR05DRAFT_952840 [Suillus weaverae]
MSMGDKITIEGTISQILVKEKSRRVSDSQTALAAKTSEESKESSKTDNNKKPETGPLGERLSQESRKAKGAEKDNEKDKSKTELSANVAAVVEKDEPSQLRVSRSEMDAPLKPMEYEEWKSKSKSEVEKCVEPSSKTYAMSNDLRELWRVEPSEDDAEIRQVNTKRNHTTHRKTQIQVKLDKCTLKRLQAQRRMKIRILSKRNRKSLYLSPTRSQTFGPHMKNTKDDSRCFVDAYERSTLKTHQEDTMEKEDIPGTRREESAEAIESECEKEPVGEERACHAETVEEPKTFEESANRPDTDL